MQVRISGYNFTLSSYTGEYIRYSLFRHRYTLNPVVNSSMYYIKPQVTPNYSLIDYRINKYSLSTFIVSNKVSLENL